jgi:CRISPR-associated endonuclease Cas2
MRTILWEQAQRRKKQTKQSFNHGLYYLRRRGVITIDENHIAFNKKLSATTKSSFKLKYTRPLGKERILVCFDIPHEKKKIRDWLRNQLKDWDFTMVQKSIWIGDGPLPKEFKDHIKLLKIEQQIKVFKVQKKT